MYKPTWARVIAAPFLFLVVLLIAAWSSGFQEIICEQTKSGEEQCASYNLAAYYLVQIKRTVDDNDGLITALATIIIAGFTAALWRSTDNLWKAGKKQMRLIKATAALQSIDMQASIKAAQESVDVARSSAEKQLRAYLSIRHMKTVMVSGQIARVKVRLVNAGQTPARKIRLAYIGQFEANPEATKIYFRPTAGRPSVMDVGPNRQMGFTINGDIILTESVLNDMARDSIRMVVAGVITYEDVFGKTRRLIFKGYTYYTDHAHMSIASCRRGNRSS
ncbi:hypothetical protein [Mesorhizobium sp.]|uniref:hypothetical protein n=1 Tax=Mesorhizobium sp. TaxID=1871066 RepID=UPI0011F45E19|nr:hypothetical protein [Mesorhizobium sp.]TIP18405.1 MAG: hypothetical protein E5X66_15580 [Mesorhizobium sp.]